MSQARNLSNPAEKLRQLPLYMGLADLHYSTKA